ncbi:MAG: hypothetical protein GY759_09370 [Chloroflexi bacterium]|nr:hypothetical protein [Chloroflexota bacterium]
MSPEQAQAQFDALQAKLVPLWKSMDHISQDKQTIVVVPSLSIEISAIPGALLQAYEERFLFLLLLLRQPRARMIYATSQSIRPEIVEYYLDLLPGVIASHARKRLFLVSPQDASPRPLTLKLLERPRLLRQISALIPDHDRAHLASFMNTILERDLALRLGIPMYGADPKFFHYGTKSGCRQLFAEEGVRHPLGIEDIRTGDELIQAIRDIRAQRPAVQQVIVKHDEGVSGMGNALLNLHNLPDPGDTSEPAAIAERLRSMEYEVPEITYTWYMQELEKHAGIVEERIQGQEFRSPSAQLRVTPRGEVELLSTHDQVLGGPSGQTYFGARFPADPAYAAAIMQDAAKVGRRLANEGVLGRFAIDFVTVRSESGEWESYAIEVNLRKGGTTHPFLTLQFLTDGVYDAEAGVFTTPRGHNKYFIASDHLESQLYRSFTADDIFDIIARTDLHFNQTHQTGVVFHMLSSLGEFGRLGLTAVGNSPEQADALFAQTVAALDEEAQHP